MTTLYKTHNSSGSKNNVTCQGTRRDAVCTDSVCSTSDPIEDDSGCDATTMSKDCAPYADAYCNGLAAQVEPQMRTTAAYRSNTFTPLARDAAGAGTETEYPAGAARLDVLRRPLWQALMSGATAVRTSSKSVRLRQAARYSRRRR